MAVTNRIENLGQVSQEVRHLSVYDQFQRLTGEGLLLDDINWKNRLSNPSRLISRIPMVGDGTLVEKP